MTSTATHDIASIIPQPRHRQPPQSPNKHHRAPPRTTRNHHNLCGPKSTLSPNKHHQPPQRSKLHAYHQPHNRAPLSAHTTNHHRTPRNPDLHPPPKPNPPTSARNLNHKSRYDASTP
ncbi:early nodulin-75-like [Glycine soja]|uniref:early nodulin-75-like n=1 Tax=Glycine soja TaxID=3848 RepID=UPI00103C84F6|nr:early nodulin-75-like [Glycine soja]